MLTYEDKLTASAVYLDGKRIGTIKQVDGGWRYYPKGGGKWAGRTYRTREIVKQTL